MTICYENCNDRSRPIKVGKSLHELNDYQLLFTDLVLRRKNYYHCYVNNRCIKFYNFLLIRHVVSVLLSVLLIVEMVIKRLSDRLFIVSQQQNKLGCGFHKSRQHDKLQEAASLSEFTTFCISVFLKEVNSRPALWWRESHACVYHVTSLLETVSTPCRSLQPGNCSSKTNIREMIVSNLQPCF